MCWTLYTCLNFFSLFKRLEYLIGGGMRYIRLWYCYYYYLSNSACKEKTKQNHRLCRTWKTLSIQCFFTHPCKGGTEIIFKMMFLKLEHIHTITQSYLSWRIKFCFVVKVCWHFMTKLITWHRSLKSFIATFAWLIFVFVFVSHLPYSSYLQCARKKQTIWNILKCNGFFIWKGKESQVSIEKQ